MELPRPTLLGSEKTPRMLRRVLPTEFPLEMYRLGTRLAISSTLTTPWRSSSSPEKAVTATGTSWSSCSRRSAVTTICSTPPSGSRCSCPAAGVASGTAAVDAHMSHLDLDLIPDLLLQAALSRCGFLHEENNITNLRR